MPDNENPAPVGGKVDILLVIPHLERGGSQRVLTTLANAWSQRGYKVTVLTFHGEERDFFPFSPGVERIVLPYVWPEFREFHLAGAIRFHWAAVTRFRLAKLIGMAAYLLELRRVIVKIGAPVIVSFLCSTNIKVILACLGLAKVRVVISERNDPARQRLPRQWEWSRRWLYRFSDVVTANSHGAIDTMRSYVPEHKLAFVPNPLCEESKAEAIPPPADPSPRLLAVGRLTAQKGYDVLLRAFSLVAPGAEPWRLSIVGDGPLEERMKAAADELEIASRVDWHGRQPDPFFYYRGSDIFLMPSRHEGSPNALLEAMSQGLPPIVTDCLPGALEVVEHDVTGLVVPVDDPEALAAAIRRLIADPDLRRRLGRSARKRVEAYAIDEVLPKWEQVLGLDGPNRGPQAGHGLGPPSFDAGGGKRGALVSSDLESSTLSSPPSSETPDRIYFVLPSLACGGAERVALTLLENLDRSRYAPELIVFSAADSPAALIPPNVPLHVLGRKRLRYALPALVRLLRQHRPATIFSTLAHVNLAIAAARPFLPRGTRLIIREANLPSLGLQAQPFPPLFALAVRLLYPASDRIIASSRRMADELENRFRIPRARLAVLPNPVDVNAIRSRIQEVLYPAREGPRFVAAGSLDRQKGFDRLIEAMPSVTPDARLIILGDGPERVSLMNLAQRLGLADRVVFPGFQPNPWEWYAIADAFVMPSRWEGMPNAALEALACGTPVIATPESGGLAEVSQAAPEGAVTIAEFGAPFIQAMNEVVPSRTRPPRPILLPAAHHIENVTAAFEEIISAPRTS